MNKVAVGKKNLLLKESLTFCSGKLYLINGWDQDLLRCLIMTLGYGAKKTTLFTTDCCTATQRVAKEKNSSIILVNAFENPFSDHVSTLLDLQLEEKELLILDSLTSLVITRGFSESLILLKRLSKAKVTVIAVIHPDCHPAEELCELQYMADCSYEPCRYGSLSTPAVRVKWRKPTGKVLDQVETYTLDSNGGIACTRVIVKDELKAISENSEEHAVLSTFRLELSSKEQEDRKQLVLPYIKVPSGEKSKITEQRSGQIFYEPDAADDFDDEDPDDDLTL